MQQLGKTERSLYEYFKAQGLPSISWDKQSEGLLSSEELLSSDELPQKDSKPKLCMLKATRE